MKILIFGCSAQAKNIHSVILEMKGFEIIGYVDNNSEKWGRDYLGKKVISPEEMKKKYSNSDIYVIIGNRYYEETYDQAAKIMGNKRVYFNLADFLMDNEAYLCAKGREVLKLKGYGLKLETESDYLLICNRGLPAAENLYRKAFVLQRLLAYQKVGVSIDAFGLIEGVASREYVFSGVTILEGDLIELENVLRQGHYKKVLVHFLDRKIYMCLKHVYGENMPFIIVWSHGFDILKWDRRRFNYTNADVEKNSMLYEKDWEKTRAFWRQIFEEKRLCCIFVSEWLKQISRLDLGMLPLHWRVIPNYINTYLFQYTKKETAMRTRILLIKSHQTRMYANDVAAKVILELSTRPFFKELFFSLYGDGRLFEENFQALIEMNFENVKIHRQYLQQNEITELHKEYGIFLCPTRQDTQGVSMCEAMSSGLVVITNGVAGVSEYIDDTCGCVCGDENYMEMADAIEYLYDNPEKYLEKSKQSAVRVRNQCGWPKTIQKELQLLADFF